MIAAIVLVILLAGYCFFTCPHLARKDADAYRERRYAHRGLHGEDAPENSLAAFDRAARAGYGMELDVQLTKDHALVVFHDDSLLRMCGADALLREKTYEELTALRLLSSGERIPLFEEVLACVDGRAPLLVELKSGADDALLVQKSLALLEGYRGAFLIESFSPIILAHVKRRAPRIPRGQLVGRADKSFRGLNRLAAILLSHLLLNFLSRPDFIAYEQSMRNLLRIRLQKSVFGARGAAWTVRSADVCKALEAGGDIVIFERFLP
jgi:glycerophosphoryl diester phosphodiesterase